MAVAVGIELSSDALRGVVLEQSGPKIRLLAAHEAVCEGSDPEALTRALSDVKRSLRIAGPIILGIPSTSAILTTVHPLIVSPERAALAIQFELQQQLPFDLADAVWHYRWLAAGNGHAVPSKSPAPSAQRASSAVAAAVRRSVLDDRLSCCRRAGLSVQAVVINPVAALNVCDAKRTASKPAPAPTAMTVLRLLDQRSAEWILSSPSQLHIVPVASASPDVFWQELAASWEALRASEASIPSPIRVIGPSDAMPRAQQILAGQRVERVDITQIVAVGQAKADQPDRLAAALGLALQGLGIAGIDLNLLAASQGEARAAQVRRAASIVSGVCAAAAVVLGLHGMLEVRQRSVRALRSLEQQEKLYQALRPEARALLQQQEHLGRRTLQLEQLAAETPALTQLIAQLSEALPNEAWLMSLEGSKTGLLTGVIEGRARSFQDVTKFMEQLKTVAGMTTVKPLSTNVTTDGATGTEVIAFSVQVQRPLPSSAGPAPKDGE